MEWSVVASLIGGLGVGSWVTQYLGLSRGRREARSEVLKHISDVEMARWGGGSNDVDYQEFRNSVRSLETAALIARVPRRVVHHYVVFAQAARLMSQTNFDEIGGDDEIGGWLETGEFSDLVSDAARALSMLAWSPALSRVRLPKELAKLRARVPNCTADEQRKIESAQGTYGRLAGLERLNQPTRSGG